ncbi:hypothetical protein KI387_043094, partial [Taxus chinensis]
MRRKSTNSWDIWAVRTRTARIGRKGELFTKNLGQVGQRHGAAESGEPEEFVPDSTGTLGTNRRGREPAGSAVETGEHVSAQGKVGQRGK